MSTTQQVEIFKSKKMKKKYYYNFQNYITPWSNTHYYPLRDYEASYKVDNDFKSFFNLEFGEWMKVNQENVEKIQKKGGVYELQIRQIRRGGFGSEEVVYVGSSKNLYERLMDHLVCDKRLTKDGFQRNQSNISSMIKKNVHTGKYIMEFRVVYTENYYKIENEYFLTRYDYKWNIKNNRKNKRVD